MAVIEHGGADVDAVDRHQETAVHAVALCCNPEANIEHSSRADTNIEARSHIGCTLCTPFHEVSNRLSREALLSLLKHGANINAQDKWCCLITLLTTQHLIQEHREQQR